MADDNDPPTPSKAALAQAQRDTAREARLAAELRKNLRRRKAAGRINPPKDASDES